MVAPAILLVPPLLAGIGKAAAVVGTFIAANAVPITATVAVAGAGTIAINSMRGDDAADEADASAAGAGAKEEECTGECDKEEELPQDPEELKEKGWKEEPTQAPNRRRFKNPETGEVLEFDKGQPGKPGWRGKDHYHRPNPNTSGKLDKYLDSGGNPVGDGSGPSHIPPGTIIR